MPAGSPPPSDRRRDRLALYGVPIGAGLVTAAMLLGPGAERPADGARVWGLIVEGAERFALRVEPRRHFRGAYLPLAVRDLRVELRSGYDLLGTWRGDTGEQAMAEADSSTAPLPAHLRVRVEADDGVLADADFDASPPLEPAAAAPIEPDRTEGTLRIEIALPRGAAVASFPEPLTLLVHAPPGAAPNLTLEAGGATVTTAAPAAGGDCAETTCAHRFDARLTVESPLAELRVRATTAAGVGHWEGRISPLLGRMWLEPGTGAGRLVVHAPHARAYAFVSVLTAAGRVGGTTLRMTEDDRGRSVGVWDDPPWPAQATTVVLSSSLSEGENDAHGWPLDPDRGWVRPRPLALLADGLPAAMEREQERSAAIRRPAYGFVLAAGLFELLYLGYRNRQARRRLHDHLRTASGPHAEETRHLDQGAPMLWLAGLFATLALAFLGLAAVAAWAGR